MLLNREPSSHPPIFVGGSGRSGTTIVGEVAGAFDGYALVPIELRFHTDRGGLAELLAHRVRLAWFLEKLTGEWYHRTTARGQDRGLHRIIGRADFDDAVARFETSFEDNHAAAAGRLMEDIVAPTLHEFGATGFVETTPDNLSVAPTLARLFPDARFINAVRDGRDVASSVTRLAWGPSDMIEAIDWWGARLIESDEQLRLVDPANRLTVRFEQLSVIARDQQFDRIAALIGTGADAARQLFADRMDPGKVHQGRWRKNLDRRERLAVQERYEAICDDLRRAGVDYDPDA